MSDPVFTDEMHAACLAVARSARPEPETVESLREALVAAEAERDAHRRERKAIADALGGGVSPANLVERVLCAVQDRDGYKAERDAEKERARVLGEALTRAADRVDLLADCEEAPSHYDPRAVSAIRDCAIWIRALSSLPAAPAKDPNLTAAAEEAMRAALRLKNGTGDLADAKALADAALDRLRIAASAPADVARVTPAVEDHGVIVSRSSAHFNVLVGGPSGIVHSIHESRIPGATVGDAVIVDVRKG